MTSDVEKWLAALPEKSIETELEELRLKEREIQNRIAVREQALTIKRSLSAESDGEDSDASPVEREASGQVPAAESDRPAIGVVNPPMRGREAIRQIIKLSSNRVEWTIPDMLAALHQRNWPANTHSVQVALSRMFKDGELGRVSPGVYIVPDHASNGRAAGTLDDFLDPDVGEGDSS
jgi:hypothetical protein